MTKAKHYDGSPEFYEKKLSKVMERFGIKQWDWDHNRREAWVQFTYKGQPYRFDHSVLKSQQSTEPLAYGSDCFAQLVLTLEDLARMVERGIYDLQTWVSGMRFLPAPHPLPWWTRVLGMEQLPSTEDEIQLAYRERAKTAHPDAGGSNEAFIGLTKARDAAVEWFGNGGSNDA